MRYFILTSFLIYLFAENCSAKNMEINLKNQSVSIKFFKFGKYKYFSLKNPNRIIFDLEMEKKPDKIMIKKEENMKIISNVKHLNNKKKLRIIFEISGKYENIVLHNSRVSNNAINFDLITRNYKVKNEKKTFFLKYLINNNNEDEEMAISFILRPKNIENVDFFERQKRLLCLNCKINNLVAEISEIKYVERIQGRQIFAKNDKIKSAKFHAHNSEHPIIVIDAGHGGFDPGTVGKLRIKEKKITLDFAKLLQKKLKQNGFKVVMTRSDDHFVSLKQRAQIARKSKGNFFISIHVDNAKSQEAHGITIYTVFSNKKIEAEFLDKSEYSPTELFKKYDTNVSDFLFNIIRSDVKNKSSTFVQNFSENIKKNGNFKKISHRLASFAVLKLIDIPSVLIETGYISNTKEERKIISHEYQDNLTNEIVNTLKQTFRDSCLLNS